MAIQRGRIAPDFAQDTAATPSTGHTCAATLRVINRLQLTDAHRVAAPVTSPPG